MIDLKKYEYVIGADEVGTGAWAGPFVVAVTVTNTHKVWLDAVMDSKQMTARQREDVAASVQERSWVAWVWPDEIDHLGLAQSLKRGYRIAIQAAINYVKENELGTYVLIADGTNPVHIEAHMIPKADAKVKAVSLASIYGKVERDKYMRDESGFFPEYSLEENKGYGTKKHQEALAKYGPCEQHRMSYKPLHKYAK